jgi:hypothetical protein
VLQRAADRFPRLGGAAREAVMPALMIERRVARPKAPHHLKIRMPPFMALALGEAIARLALFSVPAQEILARAGCSKRRSSSQQRQVFLD